MNPRKYRKKPVVIEAVQVDTSDEDELQDIIAWCGGRVVAWPRSSFAIVTREGTMAAVHGDWIIKGVKGEFYPCKPSIFAATYELADDPVDDPYPDWIKGSEPHMDGSVTYSVAKYRDKPGTVSVTVPSGYELRRVD